MTLFLCALLWFVIGALFLSGLTVVVYRTGVVYRSRERDGTLRKKLTIGGILLPALLLAAMTGFLLAFNLAAFRPAAADFLTAFLADFLLSLALVLFDSFFIDLFVLARWRPAFLRLPDEVTGKSMRLHVKKTFQFGLFLVAAVSAAAALISAAVQ